MNAMLNWHGGVLTAIQGGVMQVQKRFTRVVVTAVILAFVSPSSAWAKQSNSINQPENKEIFVSVGDMLVRVNLRESLPNAFGGPDIFGRKRDRGFIEIRYMGLSPDGRAVFRRRSVDIYTNETTMTRSQPRWGTATVTASGDTAHVSGFSVGSDRATVEPLPPDTIEFALDLSKNKIITVEERQIEVTSADSGGVKFVISKR